MQTAPDSPQNKLRTWRTSRGMSLIRLSRLLDCDPSMLSRIETGDRLPGAKTGLRARLAEVCGIPADAWEPAPIEPQLPG